MEINNEPESPHHRRFISKAFSDISSDCYYLFSLYRFNPGSNIIDYLFRDITSFIKIFVWSYQTFSLDKKMIAGRINFKNHVFLFTQRPLPLIKVNFSHLVIPLSLKNQHRSINFSGFLCWIITSEIKPVGRCSPQEQLRGISISFS